VAKPEWGKKRTCQSCGAPFYDMKRVPPTCPKCGTEVSAPASKTRRPTPAPAVEETPKPANDDAAKTDLEEAAEGDEIETLEDIENDDDDLIEDASDLGEDDDDMSEVKEHIETDIDGKE